MNREELRREIRNLWADKISLFTTSTIIILVGFLLWGGWKWAVFCFKPEPKVQVNVELWLPPRATIVNPLGVVDAKLETTIDVPLQAMLSLDDFKKLDHFGKSVESSVMIEKDGTIFYRSEIKGFSFLARDSVRNHFKERLQQFPPRTIKKVTVLERNQILVEHRKWWGVTIVIFLFVSMIVGLFFLGVLFSLPVIISELYRKWKEKGSGLVVPDPKLM